MISIPEHLKSKLNFRDRAAWAFLPDNQKAILLKAPEELFCDGLMTLDYMNRNVNGRELWVEGLHRIHQFTVRPEIVFDWIKDADLEGFDAMVSVLFDHRRGKFSSTEHIDPSAWRVLESGLALWNKLAFDRFDYPGMIAEVKKNQPIYGKSQSTHKKSL